MMDGEGGGDSDGWWGWGRVVEGGGAKEGG